ncbi:MerR family transcriptional regulator [Lutimonas zeaxanthinifaciens]|uniref:MerR family transcriptional regulator n=1 Tax=Lutimonas zeaxanthinifaciens TaxID=3060215 RepID=UPI00265D556D|nr:MerR family transcriptional regulator [Lutimonas sp. YSD2104]WKK66340.1 MerR family transcriptional regulator [Lutimonas sp. YSD2104]
MDEKHTGALTEPIYTLAVASRMSETPAHSIRQYIDKGLIIPFKTTKKRHLFSKVDIQKLKSIKKYLKEQGLNIAGINALFSVIPCWAIKSCDLEHRYHCEAYHSILKPCWMASQKGPNCQNEDCRVCDVYVFPEKFTNPKECIKKMTRS